MTNINVEELVGTYVALRDRIAEVKEGHKAELKPLEAGLDELGGMLLLHLQSQKVESVRTAAGTVYKTGWATAKVQDWDATLEFIKAGEHWDLLPRSVNKSAVEELGAVPGVVVERGIKVGVRRA